MGHRFWFACAALVMLLSACVDEPTRPVAAATRPSRDIPDVPFTRLSSHFAYVWAHQPQAPSYSPMPQYSYNATGGAIHIYHGVAGRYTVTFDGFAEDTTGHTPYDYRLGLSVVAYGATTIGCAVAFGPGILNGRLNVGVACYDRITHEYVDSRFSLLVVGAQSVEGRHSLVWRDDHSFSYAPGYTPDSATSFTTGPNPILISYDPATLSENVKFGTGNVAGTTALITPDDWGNLGGDPAMNPDVTCQLGGWVNNSVEKRCFNRLGQPGPEPAYLMQLERGRTGRRFGFAYAHQPSTASYAPAAGHSYNSSGGAITVNHTATGRYTLEFDGLQTPDGHSENVQVSPFGGDVPTACNIVRWVNSVSNTSLLVLVECRRAETGAYRDTKFNVVVIE